MTESQLPKNFEFTSRESAIASLWEQANVFRPESAADQTAPVFSIAMPPPNANGELHIGHCYGYTMMDILGRFHRMKGDRTLLIPGKDHAGIQTQVVFEKKLKAEKIDTSKVPTTQLYDQCYGFCIDRAQYMRAQEKSMGISADWSRELFTLDPRLNKIVFETFVNMWNDGLVYRGNRIVNWSVFSQTSISDVEVEYVERDGHLWYIRYDLVDGPVAGGDTIKLPNGTSVTIGAPGLITATTRPETMLGDTALVVHPDDTRYQKFIGKEVIVPLVGRKIKVIADKRIDPTFGTGVVKVTPAHDFTDYDIGVTHNLEQIQVIGKDGLMTAAAGADYAGKSTVDARALVLEHLTARGQLLDTVAMRHKVPIGERGKDVIEPLISDQWFVAVDKPGKSLKQKALALVRSDKINVHPERFRVLFEQWLENLHDWNISRQLWWGHRLPVWYRTVNGKSETYVGVEAPTGDGWTQDTDVFDTWFSSGQWAFSTVGALGLHDLTKQNGENFPTHTMVMGRDILLFWACRMLLMAAYRMDNIPWKNIFFTGLVRDEHGQKMSKSKGNGVEPKAIVAQHGTDALRMGFVMGATPGNDINFSIKKVEGYSKFVNKLWNAAKLIELKVGGAHPTPVTHYKLETTRWLNTELEKVHAHVTRCLDGYELSIAAGELYEFVWGTYCDWYLEFLKVVVDTGTAEEKNEAQWHALESFRSVLALLHPFMPFVTEELYQLVPGLKRQPTLAIESWKLPATAANHSLAGVQATVNAIRSVKAAIGQANKPIRVSLVSGTSPESAKLISAVAKAELIALDAITPAALLRKPIATGGTVAIEVLDKAAYRKKLEQELLDAQKLSASLEGKLAGDFGRAAKPELIEQERERLKVTKEKALGLSAELASF